jgi:signal transduction histidine kinase
MDVDEEKRLETLRSYGILDTPPEEEYDDLTSIAAYICGAKISLVTLVDAERQWFKSAHGLSIRETPREYSFCAHAIWEPGDMFVIEDARKDDRFKDNPLVTGEPNIVFYAGVPLRAHNGAPLGTLCVIDDAPRELSADQAKTLRALSKQVGKLLELRRTNRELGETVGRLTEKNEELEAFAKRAAHDIRSPLGGIVQTVQLMQLEHSDELSEELGRLVGWISKSAYRLIHMIDGLLSHSKSDRLLSEASEDVSISQIREELDNVVEDEAVSRSHGNCTVELDTDLETIRVNPVALNQVLRNLAGNSVKYCDKNEVRISVRLEQHDGAYHFWFSDNGPGIPPEHRDRVFELFHTVPRRRREEEGREQGDGGTGMGLATVKKLVEGMGGSIELRDVETGTTFHFTVPTPG